MTLCPHGRDPSWCGPCLAKCDYCARPYVAWTKQGGKACGIHHERLVLGT